jgi:site-specific DNA-methyltransferase (cytosine-N4-specific)
METFSIYQKGSILSFLPDKGEKPVYETNLGIMWNGSAENALTSESFQEYQGKINLIFTSPPFPLNRKKKYGNYNGDSYKTWLASFAKLFSKMLTDDGSIVMEIGNAWTSGGPEMATLGLESLMLFKQEGDFALCQQFIGYNKAKLPGPAQWVNVERIRVKDSYTNIWWMAKNRHPKADNRNILSPYSDSMKNLLKEKRYDYGKRPSEHRIGEKTFLKNNGGSIPSNVLEMSNTKSTDPYIRYCKETKKPLHPARMPESIPSFFIKFLTNEKDIVLDPFAGSNVTGFVAERLGRKWISVERDPVYSETSASRFEAKNLIRHSSLNKGNILGDESNI